jgi:hypothetical protein
MRESRTYGFVRGARGNSRPYRVPQLLFTHLAAPAQVSYWHEAGGYCDAKSRPLSKVLRTRIARAGFVSP